MRRIAVGLAVLLLACKGNAKPTTKQEAEPVAVPAPASAAEHAAPLLWVVESDKGDSYLQGTMHLGIDLLRDVHPIVIERLDASKTFVMEADISEVDPMEMTRLAQLPEGVTLDGKLTAKQWEGLTEIAPLPEDTLKQFRPWFVLVAITQSLLPSTLPMDSVLHGRAKNRGLTIAFLETWRYQVDLLDEVIGEADIIDIVESFDDTKQELKDLSAGYIAGDAAAVEKIMYDPEKYEKNPKVLDILIVRRNQEWIPKLEKHLNEGNAFIAVGVGHLVGDRGVIAMLRKRGYEISRITLPEPAQGLERPAAPATAAP